MPCRFSRTGSSSPAPRNEREFWPHPAHGGFPVERLLLLEEGHCLRNQALDVCGYGPGRRLVNYGATSLTTLLQMVEHGMGITLVPEIALDAECRHRDISALCRSATPRHRARSRCFTRRGLRMWRIMQNWRQQQADARSRCFRDQLTFLSPETKTPGELIRRVHSQCSAESSVAAEQRLPDDRAKRRARKRGDPEQPDLAQRAGIGENRRAERTGRIDRCVGHRN